MRFRLLRRRLTISSPTMAIRSRMPWPIAWALAAVVLGFSAAIGLWAFEKGKDIAGLDSDAKQELASLRDEVRTLRLDQEKAQSVANTSESLLTAERAAQEKLIAQVKQLESDNRQLKDELGFYERLIPSTGNEGVAIRGLQAESMSEGRQLKWQIVLIQPQKNAPEFNGKIEVTLSGTLAGKPWTQIAGGSAQSIKFRQSQRVENVVDVPEQVVVKQISARVTEGSTVRAVQSVKLAG
jgi:hypothetical protein